MNNFDLKGLNDLIPYRDICKTNDEYMDKINNMPHIGLTTEALYVLTPDMSVLFTPKLRYYKNLVENEINIHINEASRLLEGDKTGELTKYILKKTREAVTTLVHNAMSHYNITSGNDIGWSNITSEKPTIVGFPSSVERTVYFHYLVAELFRCWLELQDRYIHVIDGEGYYDVLLLYTSLLNRYPDKEFQLMKNEGQGNLPQLTERPKLTTSAERFAKTVAPFGFTDLPLVKVLSPVQQGELIELIVRDACYAAAMLKYLNYYNRLKDLYSYNNKKIVEHCAKALKCSSSSYTKYFYSLETKETRTSYERHDAKKYLNNKQVEKDYKKIKDSTYTTSTS